IDALLLEYDSNDGHFPGEDVSHPGHLTIDGPYVLTGVFPDEGRRPSRRAALAAASVFRSNDSTTAGAIVAVEFTGKADPDANRRLVPEYLDVVPEVLRSEHDVSRLHPMGFLVVLVLPRKLALGDEPRLVVLVVVVIVRMTGCLTDHRNRELVADDDPLGPRRWPLTLLYLGDSGSECVGVEDEALRHENPPLRTMHRRQ